MFVLKFIGCCLLLVLAFPLTALLLLIIQSFL